MSKNIKFKNDIYLDTSGIANSSGEKLNATLSKIRNRQDIHTSNSANNILNGISMVATTIEGNLPKINQWYLVVSGTTIDNYGVQLAFGAFDLHLYYRRLTGGSTSWTSWTQLI